MRLVVDEIVNSSKNFAGACNEGKNTDDGLGGTMGE